MMPITEESKSTTVRYDDLEMAYSFVSFGANERLQVYTAAEQ